MISLNLFIFLVLLQSLVFAKDIDPTCQEWFDKSKIEIISEKCIIKCSTLKVDMKTFYCLEQCQDICSSKADKISLMNLLYYPGLTSAEKKLIEKYPKEAIVVFIQKERAEFSQARNFSEGKFNDESDAFRHFIWAGLMTSELGLEKAKEFLDAHEENSTQSLSEKSMDLANNRAGILAAEALLKIKQFDLKSLEIKALQELKDGHLIVLKPGLQIPREPK